MFCPSCKAKVTAAGGGADAPNPDDPSVCLYCQALLVYKGTQTDMHLELLSEAELKSIQENEPECWQELLLMQNHVAEFRRFEDLFLKKKK